MGIILKPKELIIVGLFYLVGVALTYFAAVHLVDDAAGGAQVVGTITGTFIAIWLYQSRNPQLAPAKVKLAVGGTLAILCILQGLVFQQLFHWMIYPDIGIGVPAIFTTVIPFAFWNTFGKNAIDYWKVKNKGND